LAKAHRRANSTPDLSLKGASHKIQRDIKTASATIKVLENLIFGLQKVAACCG
jgi:hypothetical protein